MPLSMVLLSGHHFSLGKNTISQALQALCEIYIHRRLTVPSSGLTFTAQGPHFFITACTFDAAAAAVGACASVCLAV